MSESTAKARPKRRIKTAEPTTYWIAVSEIGAGMFCDKESGCPALFKTPKQAFEFIGPFSKAIPVTIQRVDKPDLKWTDFVKASPEVTR
jgi:hypothetical protein